MTSELTVPKKMATAHFTTIPCEPNTDSGMKEAIYSREIHSGTNNIVYGRFGVVRIEKFIPVLTTLCMVSSEFAEHYSDPLDQCQCPSTTFEEMSFCDCELRCFSSTGGYHPLP